jgi:hypothetical protein
MGCLAAWLIGKLKGNDIGNIYITEADDRQEFDYFIYVKKGNQCKISLKIMYGSTVLYDDLIDDFNPEEVEKTIEEE